LLRQIIRVILIGLAFYFVFPAIPGIQVHGSLVHIFIAAIVFAFLGWLVETLAITISTILAIGTLGLALLILIPLWLLGFWMIPAIALRLLAHFLPTYLSIGGWIPAIIGGLVMLFIGVLTGGNPNKYRQGSTM
jgi:uncharacterized membrane protein YvlD (DUF360 family)